MSILEKAIAYVSPRTAARRAKYRMAVQHFDGAGNTYRQKHWKAPGGDARNVTFGAINLLRRRSRDMVRNNAIARRAVEALVNNVVGDGIIPSIESDDRGLKSELEAVLVQHCDTRAIDAHGNQNLYGLQRMAFRSIVESGEMLWLERSRRRTDGLPLNFQVESLEAEFIDERYSGTLLNRNNEVQGIELDLLGRRVAYRLYEEHPEGYFNTYPESRRVSASRVIHAFNVERPGQLRGVPWMAPVMSLISDAYDYQDAQLLRTKIAAMFVGFIRDVNGDGLDINAPNGMDPANVDDLVPGMFEELPPGRDVTFSSPPKVDGHAEHMSSVLHMIAAGLGLTYEAVSMQLGEVNFSSARMGRIEMNRQMSAHQWTLVIPQICQPFEGWLRKYAADVVGPNREYKIKWTPPRFEMVDPAREVPPMLESIAGGLTSRQRVIRTMGHDPEEIDAERAEDAEREGHMGLTDNQSENDDESTPPER